MPTNIPGSSASFPANVVGPSGGDTRNATSVNTGLEDLADRTAYLKAKAGVTDEGIQRIRTVADVAALKAIGSGDRADKDVAVIPSIGVFLFESGSSATGDDSKVIQPTSGTGRWLLVDRNRRVSALIDTNPGGSPLIHQGYGVASVARQSTSNIRVTLSVARATTYFAVLVAQHLFGGGGGIFTYPVVFMVQGVSSTVFDISAYDTENNAYVDMSVSQVGISISVPD